MRKLLVLRPTLCTLAPPTFTNVPRAPVNLLFFLSYVLPHSRLGVRLLQKDVSTGHVPLLRVLVRVLLSVRLRLRQLL